ncbi:MAG: hypothetical protein R3Y58_07000 [Eubacteriales bacterium]
MITDGYSKILKIVAVDWDGGVLPPCGRCREFINQIHDENRNAEVLIDTNVIVRLKDLLPYDWKSKYEAKVENGD